MISIRSSYAPNSGDDGWADARDITAEAIAGRRPEPKTPTRRCSRRYTLRDIIMAQLKEHSLSGRVAQWTSGLDPLAVGATWLVFLLAIPFLEGRGPGIEALIGGGLIGLPLVVVGYLAASGCRSTVERGSSERAKIAVLALLVGLGLGALNLGVNVGLTTVDASIRALLQEHLAEHLTWARVASVAVVEEVVSRLFLMSIVAWIAACFVSRPRSSSPRWSSQRFCSAWCICTAGRCPLNRRLPRCSG